MRREGRRGRRRARCRQAAVRTCGLRLHRPGRTAQPADRRAPPDLSDSQRHCADDRRAALSCCRDHLADGDAQQCAVLDRDPRRRSVAALCVAAAGAAVGALPAADLDRHLARRRTLPDAGARCVPIRLHAFLLQLCVVAASIRLLWRPAPAPRPAAASSRHAEAWVSWGARIALFILAFCVLLSTAKHATDPRWVGMASSLPLPGLFALAYLAARHQRKM